MGRVLGSLCAITSREGEGEGAAESAMLASWISQVPVCGAVCLWQHCGLARCNLPSDTPVSVTMLPHHM